ncbi:hypothetical protein K438DRAFT_2075625 [Mycena galopus ATCC 62051]|nr:hypothetical protein K438DRAFT_2075625 [Mycena galopus ATCC 62051]
MVKDIDRIPHVRYGTRRLAPNSDPVHQAGALRALIHTKTTPKAQAQRHSVQAAPTPFATPTTVSVSASTPNPHLTSTPTPLAAHIASTIFNSLAHGSSLIWELDLGSGSKTSLLDKAVWYLFDGDAAPKGSLEAIWLFGLQLSGFWAKDERRIAAASSSHRLPRSTSGGLPRAGMAVAPRDEGVVGRVEFIDDGVARPTSSSRTSTHRSASWVVQFKLVGFTCACACTASARSRHVEPPTLRAVSEARHAERRQHRRAIHSQKSIFLPCTVLGE